MTVQQRPAPGKYKLTVDDFLRLDDTGVFGTTRTELLDEDIIIMNAEYRPQGWIRGELWYRLRRALEAIGSDLTAINCSVRVSDHDMPLPDIVLTREPKGDRPIPLGSLALIAEVSSSTLQRDMGDKVTIYARAGVPEYCVVDVNARLIYQMWAPAGERYAERHLIQFGKLIAAKTVAELRIETSAL